MVRAREENVGQYQPLRVRPTKKAAKKVSKEHTFWNSFRNSGSAKEVRSILDLIGTTNGYHDTVPRVSLSTRLGCVQKSQAFQFS